MRVLLVHNYYGSGAPSGENIQVGLEHELLLKNGMTVELLSRSSDALRALGGLGSLIGGAITPWNEVARWVISRKIRTWEPDIVHVHNTFPRLSPSIFYGIPNNVPRVITLHNYRLFCADATLMRKGQVCTECVNARNSFSSVKHGCYRGGRATTVPLAISIQLHRALGTWRRKVDCFIAFSEFQRGVLIAAGLPAHKVKVKPNFSFAGPRPVEWEHRENMIAFVGRLSPEKGVQKIIEAWALWGASAPTLNVIGDGPLMDSLRELSTKSSANVRFRGRLTPAEASAQIARAKLLLVPSTCVEGFPLVIKDALAFGTPLGVSSVGPLPEIINVEVSGFAYEPRPSEILLSVQKYWASDAKLRSFSAGARRTFERLYTAERNFSELLSIYECARVIRRESKQ